MGIFETILKAFLSNPHLFIILLIVGGSVFRAVLQGASQARKRREEVETQRRERGDKPIDWREILGEGMDEPEPPMSAELPPAPPTVVERRSPPPPPMPALVLQGKGDLTAEAFRDALTPLAARGPESGVFPSALTEASSAEDGDREPAGAGARSPWVRRGVEHPAVTFEDWRSAIVLRELLGPPVSLRGTDR